MSFEANRGHADGKSGVGHGVHALNPISAVAGALEQARTARPTTIHNESSKIIPFGVKIQF